MRVILFGATGMVGQSALRECLLAPDVESILTVGRTATGIQNSKLREIVIADLFDIAAYADQMVGFDACFYCLGVASTGMTEEAYTRLTETLTLKIAETLVQLNPAMTFVYVSGSGTNNTGRMMWARVKGRTENALIKMPFRGAYMFRPGFIEPLHGIQSKTRSYRIFYTVLRPLFTVLHRLFPNRVLTTEEMGLAMLRVARSGWSKNILETHDLRALLQSSATS